MQDLQEIWTRTQQVKKQRKELRAAYKEALQASQEYVEITEKIKTIRERKKQIEMAVQSDFSSEFTKLDDLAIDLASDVEMLSDIAMTKLMKGETVEVKDEYDNTYEPIFSVRFKKT